LVIAESFNAIIIAAAAQPRCAWEAWCRRIGLAAEIDPNHIVLPRNHPAIDRIYTEHGRSLLIVWRKRRLLRKGRQNDGEAQNQAHRRRESGDVGTEESH
jgi:hypothetical protein